MNPLTTLRRNSRAFAAERNMMSAALKEVPNEGPKLSLKASDFLSALKAVAFAISRRSTTPMCGCVLIGADRRGVYFTSNNLDERILHVVNSDGDRDTFAVAVPFNPLLKVASTFDLADTVILTSIVGKVAVQDRLRISCGAREVTLFTMPAADFPDTHPVQQQVEFALPTARLLRLIDKVRGSIAAEETRYYLNGIFLHTTDVDGAGMLRAVATDGHRMSIADEPLPEIVGKFEGIIIPRPAVKMLAAAASTADAALFLIGPVRTRVVCGDTEIVFKQVDGTFPEYMRVIPKDLRSVTRLPAKVLAQATNAARIISRNAVAYAFRQGSVMVTVDDPQLGSFAELLMAEHAGESQLISFNGRYVLELLNSMSGAVEIHFNNSGEPTQWVDVDDKAARHVLMPMRLP